MLTKLFANEKSGPRDEDRYQQPYFIGRPNLRLYDGTQSPYRGGDPGFEVMEDFIFVDKRGLRWTVHEKDIVDGASIPWFMQWFGTPFNRSYLGPSMLHDVYCRDRPRPWYDTHRMFYEAMLCSGVEKWKAYSMWGAVLAFGPHW